MLTRKHFRGVAAVICEYANAERLNRDLASQVREQAAYEIAEKLAAYFKTENPHFDRTRFLNACVGEESV